MRIGCSTLPFGIATLRQKETVSSTSSTKVVIIGAGPAGLSCAHQLLEHDIPSIVLESDPVYVGGLARTVFFEGNRFDIGGHRFFSKSARVREFWNLVLGSEMLTRPRQSRIMYRGRLLQYPLQLSDTYRQLGALFLLQACGSYLWAQINGPRSDASFEDWIIKRFGRTLYHSFFKSYTEKVWGIPCSQISADWASQRIQGLSIPAIVQNLFQAKSTTTIKTLIDQFQYPRLGPGQLWETVADKLQRSGTSILLDRRVVKITSDGPSYQVDSIDQTGELSSLFTESIVSTMPLRELLHTLSPEPPASVLHAAKALRYRDFIAVALVLDCPSPFSDQWLYIHEPQVQVGRVQNMVNWSEAMVANPDQTVLLMEYFCHDEDTLWQAPDETILAHAINELDTLALAGHSKVLSGKVIRTPKAYPVYDQHYAGHLAEIKAFLASAHPRIQTIGRNGMHRYNNQDHAILTGFHAADALAGITCSSRSWSVNQDAQYIEEVEERLVPQALGD